MSFETSAETCIAVSAALPTTHDAAGFGALTYTQIGSLETIGDLTVRYAAASFTSLCSGKTSTKKGSMEAATVQVVAALDDDDAGQVLMNTAVHDKADYAFQITEKDDEGNDVKVYFRGNVLEATRRYGSGPNDIKRRQYNIGAVVPDTGDLFIEA